jgi:ribonuclease HII
MSTVALFAASRVAGVDEAGRGPLAGPVVAAAVLLDPRRGIEGLADSKLLAPDIRQQLAQRIMARASAWSVAWADAAEIDCLNILAASMLAMRRAVDRLGIAPEHVVVDGNCCPRLSRRCTVEAVIGGDASIPAVSAASILAKVWRDDCMLRLDARHPGYGFARHKGYPTAEHRAALLKLGPCAAHRRSFAPVARLFEAGAP